MQPADSNGFQIVPLGRNRVFPQHLPVIRGGTRSDIAFGNEVVCLLLTEPRRDRALSERQAGERDSCFPWLQAYTFRLHKESTGLGSKMKPSRLLAAYQEQVA